MMDTSTFTHFCRARRQDILQRLAPHGIILLPDTVLTEVEAGRDRGYDIPPIASFPWVERGILTLEEEYTQLLIKVDMPSKRTDPPRKHLGECAVLACAKHRTMVAVIDDGDARTQARQRELPYITTMWIIAEAHKTLAGIDCETTEQIYQDLLATDMKLPAAGTFHAWAARFDMLNCRTPVIEQS
ncbi:hypothetical protein [Nocardia harenae]|uniref:hypothetical protein n=1 Tax=Nocardia harenae TaxID=358707 RepID=UPI000B22D2BF|nr:hypothetical protein [Nocardia harenae]